MRTHSSWRDAPVKSRYQTVTNKRLRSAALVP